METVLIFFNSEYACLHRKIQFNEFIRLIDKSKIIHKFINFRECSCNFALTRNGKLAIKVIERV